MKFCILGAGAWGTAMAVQLARSNSSIYLVPRRQEQALMLDKCKENIDYLPGIALGPSIIVTSDLSQALRQSDILFLACPSHGLRSLCEALRRQDLSHIKCILTLCKGLEKSTFLKPVELVESIFPNVVCGVLSGPTNAKEVALGKPTAVTLASKDNLLNNIVSRCISNNNFRVYTSNDVIGVELGSCLKNIYAIGAGISDGLGLGDNAKAAYLTRALSELVVIGTHLGGQKSTFYGLSGFGDLVATCQGKWSRNRTFGEEIAQGQSLSDLLSSRKTVVEGYWATDCFYALCKKNNIDTPILDQIHSVLYQGKPPSSAIQNLMERSLKAEL